MEICRAFQVYNQIINNSFATHLKNDIETVMSIELLYEEPTLQLPSVLVCHLRLLSQPCRSCHCCLSSIYISPKQVGIIKSCCIKVSIVCCCPMWWFGENGGQNLSAAIDGEFVWPVRKLQMGSCPSPPKAWCFMNAIYTKGLQQFFLSHGHQKTAKEKRLEQ